MILKLTGRLRKSQVELLLEYQRFGLTFVYHSLLHRKPKRKPVDNAIHASYYKRNSIIIRHFIYEEIEE